MLTWQAVLGRVADKSEKKACARISLCIQV